MMIVIKRLLLMACLVVGLLPITGVARASGGNEVPEATLFFSACPQGPYGNEYGRCKGDPPGEIPLPEPESIPPEIFSLAKGDSERRRLTDNEISEFRPIWSPNGDQVVMSGGPSANLCSLYVMNPASGNVAKIYEADMTCPRPMGWSPNSAWLTFQDAHYYGARPLYKVRPNGEGLEDLTPRFWDQGHEAYDASWLSNQRIVYNQYLWDGRDGIITMDADGENRNRIFGRAVSDSALSPSRKAIAYSVSDNPEVLYEAEIYLMSLDGSHRSRLTHNRRDESYLSWSPDGLKLAFLSYGPSETKDRVGVVNPRTQNVKYLRLPDGVGGIDPSFPGPVWSPSGKYVAIAARNDNFSKTAVFVGRPGERMTRVTRFSEYMDLHAWR